MGEAKLYHILYADNIRFNSLAAQIYGKVAENLTEDEQFENGQSSSTTLDMKIVQHQGGSSESKSAVQSTHYTFQDASYFEVLDKLEINLSSPEVFSPAIINGGIHVLDGALKISGAAAMAPFFSTLENLFPQIRSHPELLGLDDGSADQSGNKNKKVLQKKISDMESMVKLLSKLPIPPAFRLGTKNGNMISGPIDEKAVRIDMGNMMLLFRGQLPFNWIVVGYLYPLETQSSPNPPEENSGLFECAENALLGTGQFLLPPADAIMIPLLILR